ncbi:MAG: 6-phosphogluconolactonase [Gammaproteobacteria bacterium]
MTNWHIYQTSQEVARAAAEYLASRIRACIAERDICHVVLPGGNTPAQCLDHLVTLNLPWNSIHWYPGDERCLPAGDAERNDVMLARHLWQPLKIHLDLIHRMAAEKGPEIASEEYARELNGLECFDIVVLGIGEDGHTASLFPGNIALQASGKVTPVYDSPKPPPERVSLTLQSLRQARLRIVLATGKGKHDAIVQSKSGAPLPINRIGDLQWFVDEAALFAGTK